MAKQKAETKANEAWQQIFDKYDILHHIQNEGVFSITANQIKPFYEPRLITKFDWSSGLPKLLKSNHLAILPTNRGTYSIAPFKAYKKLDVKIMKPTPMPLPDWIQTFDKFDITSEAVALNVAKATGMIDVIMNSPEECPAVDTITGRIGSGDFNYNIAMRDNSIYNFTVKKAQVEIDAGFENVDSMAVIEAKSHIPDDFMIRQLYHPYRVYYDLGIDKPILPFYFTYADEVYNFYQYEFTDYNNYSSIKAVQQFSFIVDRALNLNIDVVKEISAKSPMFPETSDFPYPQANTFSMVLDTIKYLNQPRDKYELAEQFSFNSRQSDYYANSVRFLGLATKEHGKYQLNELGRQVNKLPNSDARNKIIIKQLLSHITFKKVFDSYIRNLGNADDAYIEQVLGKYVPKISGTTIHRRASAVKQWINWIFSVIV